jgi:hypothetical protein
MIDEKNNWECGISRLDDNINKITIKKNIENNARHYLIDNALDDSNMTLELIFDNKNCLLSVNYIDNKTNKIINNIEYSYSKFDFMGNWIECNEKNILGSTDVIMRQLEYY